MAITVWSETVDTAGKILKNWNTCTFSAYGMALEYAGYSGFPSGAGTAAERDAFAGPYNTPAGATLAQVDKQAQSRYGVTLPAISGSLSDALKKPNTALVVTGNYAHLDPSSKLAGSVVGWNGYNKSGALPDVDHAVTVLVNPDGTLTWLDPTAPMGSNGVTVTAADVVKFNGGNLTNYPARQIAQNALGNSTTATSLSVPFGNYFAIPGISQGWNGYTGDYSTLNQQMVDEWAQGMVEQFSSTEGGYNLLGLDWLGFGNSSMTEADQKVFKGLLVVAATPFLGTPVKDLPKTTNILNAPAKQDTSIPAQVGLPDIVAILGKLTNPANWLHLGAMAVGVGLVGFGMVVVVRDLNETGPQGLVSPIPVMLKRGA
jgi:hypothetical protein